MGKVVVFSVLGCLLVACGGSEPPPQVPDAEAPMAAAPPAPLPEAEAEAPKEEPNPAPAPVAEPQFTDGMSVDEAIKAVPQGAERANIDQETLGKPLQDFALYEPCKPGTAKVKMRIAV